MERIYKTVKVDGRPVYIFGLGEMGNLEVENFAKGVTVEEIDESEFDRLNKKYTKENPDEPRGTPSGRKVVQFKRK